MIVTTHIACAGEIAGVSALQICLPQWLSVAPLTGNET